MRIWSLVLLLLVSSDSFAVHTCQGVVQSVDLNGNGNVHAQIEGMGQGNLFCSLTSDKGLIGMKVCEAMFSSLLAAYSSQKPVKLWFKIDTNTSCDKGNWENLAEHGFYYLRSQ